MGFPTIDFTTLSNIDLDQYLISTTLDRVRKNDCCTCFRMMCSSGSFDRISVALTIQSNIDKRTKDLEKLTLDTLGKIQRNVEKLAQKFSKPGSLDRGDVEGVCDDVFRAAIEVLTQVQARSRPAALGPPAAAGTHLILVAPAKTATGTPSRPGSAYVVHGPHPTDVPTLMDIPKT
jgi:hypothetical protein